MAANILRDAVLVRLENIRFEAYVHVNALNVAVLVHSSTNPLPYTY